MTAILYKRQKQILNFVVENIRKHGYAPTLTEIAGFLGLSSLSTVHEHLSVLEKKGLAGSEYTMTEMETLPALEEKAAYYWRVKAIDGASNEGVWSAPRSFRIASGFALPDWAKYTLIGVGAVLVGLLGFWLGRRSVYYTF